MVIGPIEQKAATLMQKIRNENKKLNILLQVNDKLIEQAAALDAKKAKGKLAGKFIVVKSNIMVKGMIANCASKTVENFVCPYDATVIEKIKAEDGLIVGMANMDEFACGGSGENSAYGATENPAALGYIPGGSSSGSVAAVAAGFCDISLGSDTGGSIRNPASHCGVVGLKPSYGCVSRYGLVDLAMSLDQIGPVSKNVGDVFLLLDIIKGKDPRDPTTLDFVSHSSPLNNARIGILRINGVDSKIQKMIDVQVKNLHKIYGWQVKEVNIDAIDLAVEAYYPLVYSECFSSTRKFDGRRYGLNINESAGPELLRRMIGGSEITEAEHAGAYYQKALEVKRYIKKQFEEVFKSFDAIILPTCPGLPWKIGEKMKVEEVYAYDACTIPANLAGICAISIPLGTLNKIPVGMQIFCKSGDETKLRTISELTSKLAPLSL
ncbi:MAG TPA: amidase family protein [Candidatus Nanoarchaeia archaeon]|nr:amidase family protein [Candidatus Nanoarchaeia archaeon]